MNKMQISFIKKSLFHRIHLNNDTLKYFQKDQQDVLNEAAFPMYNLQSLKAGVTCHCCYSFSTYVSAQTTFCRCCGEIEDAEETIRRHCIEFKLLFPDEPITTAQIYHWCDGQFAKQRVYRVLRKSYQRVGKTKGAQYE